MLAIGPQGAICQHLYLKLAPQRDLPPAMHRLPATTQRAGQLGAGAEMRDGLLLGHVRSVCHARLIVKNG